MIFRPATLIADNYDHPHMGDVKRIQKVAQQNGYEADLEACAFLWEEHSDTYAAGWVGLPDDDEDLWLEVEYEARRASFDEVRGIEI